MRYLIMTAGYLGLAACGSIYSQAAPSASDTDATQQVMAKLPAPQGQLLRLWQARHPNGDETSLGAALQGEQQRLIAQYKAKADGAELICVLIRSRSPRVDRRPIEVLPDPFAPQAKSASTLAPCDAMTHYQGILARIRNVEIPRGT